MSRIVGAYACPRGVFGVECRVRRDGLEVLQSFEVHAPLDTPIEAAAQLNHALSDAGIRGAEIALAVRDRKSTRLNSSHIQKSRMPSSA